MRSLGILGWSLLAACSVVLSAGGCAQSDCEKACELAKTCPDVPAAFASLPCDDACEFQEEQSDRLGCGAQLDAFNACGAAAESCETNVTCSAEATAWSECLDAAF